MSPPAPGHSERSPRCKGHCRKSGEVTSGSGQGRIMWAVCSTVCSVQVSHVRSTHSGSQTSMFYTQMLTQLIWRELWSCPVPHLSHMFLSCWLVFKRDLMRQLQCDKKWVSSMMQHTSPEATGIPLTPGYR